MSKILCPENYTEKSFPSKLPPKLNSNILVSSRFVSFCIFSIFFQISALINESFGCLSAFNDGLSRMLPSPFGTQRSQQNAGIYKAPGKSAMTRINSPGQRFTATHGISAKAGEKKLFLFVVDREDVNYLAVSSNVAIEGSRGGPEKYELYMKYGQPPTPRNYDQKSTLTASDSYIGDVLFR